jgi:hypothetical protein
MVLLEGVLVWFWEKRWNEESAYNAILMGLRNEFLALIHDGFKQSLLPLFSLWFVANSKV